MLRKEQGQWYNMQKSLDWGLPLITPPTPRTMQGLIDGICCMLVSMKISHVQCI